MGQREFAREVAERTGLSREESADLTRAVLEGLCGQLSVSEAERLAAELPGSFPVASPAPRRRQGAHPLAVDQFIRQMSEHTGLREDETRSGTGAVLATLREELSDDAYGHVVGQLPAGYVELMEPAS
ncbi:MAG TPA: DUF2267 domain-containing protein [Streptosporangiaceae bacterium]|nr:DUF2267 domain-containing protein [Streptosporangiaceae bacterium]